MTFGNHAGDEGRIRGRDVDGTFAKIVSRHEESGVEAELLQCVQELTRVKIRSVIVGQGYHVLLRAIIDVIVIRNTPEQRSWIIQRCGSCRCGTGIASTELPLAIRIRTVAFADTAVSLTMLVAISPNHKSIRTAGEQH